MGKQKLSINSVCIIGICYQFLIASLFAGVKCSSRPNVILILTDDQDVILNGMTPMRLVNKLIGEVGTTFKNAFTTSPLCCPSRASILTGKYVHNHRTVNNSVSGGCNGDYWRHNMEMQALPQILHSNGYQTFFAGKYLNQYKGNAVPPGWSEFYGLHGNSRYYNYTLRENSYNKTYKDTYLTDLINDFALTFLKKYSNVKDKPFFMMLAPPAPHEPFTPAERHYNHFGSVSALKTPNFNFVSKDKHWLVSHIQAISNHTLQLMDDYFHKRWETLLAVDEMVAAVIHQLEQSKILKNTYILYTSDNGYHIGQFAQPIDKRQPYETDIRVPFVMRGPHIPHGLSISEPIALIDIAPSILQWTNITIDPLMDGSSIQDIIERTDNLPNHLTALKEDQRVNLLIQYYGEGNLQTYNPSCPWKRTDRLALCSPEIDCYCQDSWNNTYACLRHLSKEDNFLYCEFNDSENFAEMYDLTTDPYQMKNVINELLPITRALYSISLDKLKKCVGTKTCANIHS